MCCPCKKSGGCELRPCEGPLFINDAIDVAIKYNFCRLLWPRLHACWQDVVEQLMKMRQWGNLCPWLLLRLVLLRND